jgi:hypothetical protein
MNDNELINQVIELTEIQFDKMVSNNYNDIFINKYKIFDTRQVIEKTRDGIILPDSEHPKRDLTLMHCKKAFLDLMTNMVARETCYKDENQLYIARFQKIVNAVFENNIQKYINFKNERGAMLVNTDILFLYKGGTTMKILYNKYKKILETKNFGKLFNYLKGDFERSDSDYSILINPSINYDTHNITFEEIYYDINKLSYLCLCGLRFIFQTFPDYFVPLNFITETIISNKLAEMNNVELPKIKARHGCTNVQNIKQFIGISYQGKHYFDKNILIPDLNLAGIDTTFINKGQDLIDKDKRIKEFINNKCLDTKVADFVMSLTDDNVSKYFKKYNTAYKNDIYLSLNESNEYNNNGTLAYFSLHRLKINFVAYYISNDGKFGFFECPSELIDVSILKKMASGLPLFFNHVDLEQKNYLYNSELVSLNYKSYSLYGHINDLILVLFDVAPYPWEDNKYKKRINRILFFVLLELCINVKKHSLFKQILVFMRAFSFYGTRPSEESLNNMKKILFQINKIINPLGNFGSESFFERLIRLTAIDLNDADLVFKFKEFFEKINNFIKQFDTKELLPADIEDENTDIELLGGGNNDIYYAKYLKYKAKYLQLKNK